MKQPYDLLSPAEQRLLSCSVFAGGCDLAAATAVAAGPPQPLDDYTVLDGLDGLVRKSLLAAVPAAGRTRCTMLETARAFAEEQLIGSGWRRRPAGSTLSAEWASRLSPEGRDCRVIVSGWPNWRP
jgi:predicted ATPase